MTEYFFPRLESVEALRPYRLRTIWNTREVLEVDVGDVLRRTPALSPILVPEVFNQVHLGEGGQSIEWMDEEFGADNVYAWAKEQADEVSHQMLCDWIHRNRLSLNAAAKALGISPRAISDYRMARKPIPRTIWLACLGWDAIQQDSNQPASACFNLLKPT